MELSSSSAAAPGLPSHIWLQYGTSLTLQVPTAGVTNIYSLAKAVKQECPVIFKDMDAAQMAIHLPVNDTSQGGTVCTVYECGLVC
jgi:hypothetical protein